MLLNFLNILKFVYLMQSEISGDYKIGISKHPEKRKNQHQTGNSEKINIIYTFKSQYPSKVETALKNYLMPYKVRGEWFKLSLEQELEFLKLCDKFEKNFQILKENHI